MQKTKGKKTKKTKNSTNKSSLSTFVKSEQFPKTIGVIVAIFTVFCFVSFVSFYFSNDLFRCASECLISFADAKVDLFFESPKLFGVFFASMPIFTR